MNPNRLFQTRLQWRLLLWLLPLIALPMLVLAFVITQQWQASLREQVNATEQASVTQDADAMRTFLQNAEGDIVFLSQLDNVRDLVEALNDDSITVTLFRQQVANDFVAFANGRAIYNQVRLFDPNGNEVVRVDSDGQTARSVPNNELQNKADRDYFIQTATQPEGGIYISPLNLNREGTPPSIQGNVADGTLVPVLRYGMPLYVANDATGQRELAAVVVTNIFAESLLELASVRGEGNSFVVNADGYYLRNEAAPQRVFGFEPSIETVGGVQNARLSQDFDTEFVDSLLSVVRTGNFENSADDTLVYYERVAPPSAPADYYWVLGHVRDANVVFADVNEVVPTTALITALLLVVAGALITLITRRVTQPIQRLSAVAGQLSAGRFDLRAEDVAQRSDEIGELGRAFNGMAESLQEAFVSQEQQVRQRTRDLQTSIEVGQLVTRLNTLEDLLPRVSLFIAQRFDLYHVQIYLLDDAGRYARLSAATGEAGEQLLAKGHRLDLTEQSLVAQAVQSGVAVLVEDTEATALHKENPLLPDTRSELTIPLIVGEQTLGVLDLQANRPGALNPDNQAVFEALANQLAGAVRSAQTYAERAVALERAEQISQRQTAGEWQSYLGEAAAGVPLGYQYDLEAPKPLAPDDNGHRGNGRRNGNPGWMLEKSVTLNGQVIGQIAIGDEQERTWRTEEVALIDSVADRLAETLDRMRATDATQIALQQAEGLYQLSQGLVGVTRPDEILDVLVRQARRQGLSQAFLSTISLDEMGQPHTVTTISQWVADPDTPSRVGVQHTLDVYPAAEVLLSNPQAPLLIGDMATDPRLDESSRAMGAALDVSAMVIIPLVFAEQWVGLATLGWEEPRTFTATDHQYYSAAAPQIAAILESQRLFDETNRRAAELQTVAEVSAEATQVLDIDQLLNDVALLTRDRFELYHAHIYLLNQAGDTLELVAGAGDVGEQMVAEGRSIPLAREKSLVAQAARQRRGIIANDVTIDPNFLPHPLLPNTQSELAVPMLAGDTVIGVLDVQSEHKNRFSDADVRIKTTLASQIGIAVQNARYFAASDQRARELALVADVGIQASTILDVNKLLQKVNDLTTESFGLYHMHIFLADPSGENLTLLAGGGRAPCRHVGTNYTIGIQDEAGGLVTQVARTWRPIIANDTATEEGFMPSNFLPDTRAQMVLPLVANNELVGVVDIQSDDRGAFSDEDLIIQTTLASQIAIALQNARAYEIAQRLVDELETVSEVSAEVTRNLDLDDMLRQVALLTRDRFELYHAHIYLLDAEGQSLDLAAGAGDVGERMVQARHGIALTHERSLVARAAREKQTLVANDVTAEPDFLPNPLLPATRAEMAIPMIVGDTVIGVLDVQARQRGRFTDQDIRVKGTLAAQVASAVQTARAFEESRRQATILETSEDFIALTTMEGEIIYLNPGGIKMMGFADLAEAQQMLIPDYHDEAGAQLVLNKGVPTILKSDTWRAENTIISRDGTVIPVDQTLFIVRDDDGNPQNIGTIMIDISERKAQEEALESQRRLLEAILNQIPSGIFVVAAPDGTPLLSNSRAEELLGRGISPDARSEDLVQVYAAYRAGTDESYPTEKTPIVRGLMGEEAYIDDMEVHRGDERILLEVSGAPIRDDAGEVIASVISFQDITERRAQELAIQRRALELQTVAEVSAQASQVLDIDRLLQDVSLLTRDRFDLYHAHIYLLNEVGDTLELVAGAGEVGQQMVAEGRTIPLEREQSLVATAARTREGVIVNDVTADENFLPHPLLPDTRAEMAIPLIVGGEVLGVLDVQAAEADRFTEEDVRVQSTLAGQIAVAVQNARAFAESQRQATILETSDDFIALTTMEGEIIYLNPGGIKMMGFADLAEAQQMLIPDYHDEAGAQLVLNKGVPEILENDTWRAENTIISRDGTVIPVDQTLFIVRDDDGNPQNIGTIMTDIRERKAQEEELESQRRLLEAILNQIPSGIFVVAAPDGTPLLSNSRAEELLGRGISPDARSEDLVQVYAAYRAGTDEPYPTEKTPIVRGLMGEEAYIDDMEVHRGDERILLEVSGAPIRNAEGEVIASVIAFQDITERQAQREEIESQRRLLQAVLNNIPSGIFVVSAPDGTPILSNPRAEELLGRGISPGAIEDDLTQIYAAYKAGTNDIYPTEEAPVVRGLYGETVSIDDMEVERPDGNRILLEIDGAPVRDEEGNIVASLVSFQDITERRAQERETQRMAREMATVSEVGAQAATNTNIEDLLWSVTELTKENFGLYHAHIYLLDDDEKYLTLTAGAGEAGRQMVEHGHRIALSREDSIVARAARDRAAVIENHVALADGFLPNPLLPSTESEMAVPLIVGDRLLGVLDVQAQERGRFSEQDVRVQSTLAYQIAVAYQNAQALTQTEKRAAELQTVAQVSATAATELNVSRLLKSVSDLAKERFDLYHAHIYLMNDETERLELVAGAGAAGDRMVSAHHAIALSHEHSLVARAARERQGVIVNDVQANPDFLPNPLLPQTRAELAVPLVVADQLIGVLDVQSEQLNRFTDEDVRIKRTLADQVAVAVQTARLYAEQVETAEQLREFDRLKSEFLASMSHELRTPLNSIIGYAEVILDGIDGPINEEVQEDVGAIYSSGKLLLSLINDILDLAKIEAGQLDLVTEPIEIEGFLNSLLDTSRILVKDKPVELLTDLQDDLPMMQADRLRAQQVINNLLSNAAKFTDEGTITVRVRRTDEAMIRFEIIDTGTGISEDKLETIFERFRQADQSSTRRVGGTGLGLAITRQLVEMHGGDIHVESQLGAGSTFWFTMPVAQTDTADAS